MQTPVASQQSASLSKELSEFLIEFSIALHKHAIYPEGHPLLASSQYTLILRLAAMLEERGTLSLGVARRQLVIEGVATDAANPILRELAQRLHRHHLGAVRFSRGVTEEEIAEVLRTLAADGSRSDKPLGLGPPEELSRWPNVRLFPLTFEHLELVEEDPDKPPEARPDDGTLHTSQLWIGLARAALASDTSDRKPADESPSGEGPQYGDPAVVAKAIDEHSREQAYDQVIVGYLLQIATELRRSGGGDLALRRRVSRLVREMRPETLRHLLAMGGDLAQRKRFMVDAADGMTVDTIVELLRAAAESSGQSVSQSMLRMLNKMAHHAEGGPQHSRPTADTALRDNVKRIVASWSLPDPNPAAYRVALNEIAGQSTGPRAVGTEATVEPERILEMSLEIGAVGPATLRAVSRFVESGRTQEVIDRLDSNVGDAAAREAIWEKISTPDTLRNLARGAVPNLQLIKRLVGRLGAYAADPLLDVLESADERSAQWKLLDILLERGIPIGENVAVRLKRKNIGPGAEYNLLHVLTLLPELAPGSSFSSFATHSDPRVRREALKLQLRLPQSRTAGIVAGLGDSDARVVSIALGAASQDCPPQAAPLLFSLVRNRKLDPLMRVLAIKALAGLRAPGVVEELLSHVEGSRSFMGLGARRLADKSSAMLAALNGLAAHWSSHLRAARMLKLAGASPDQEIRAAVTTPADAR